MLPHGEMVIISAAQYSAAQIRGKRASGMESGRHCLPEQGAGGSKRRDIVGNGIIRKIRAGETVRFPGGAFTLLGVEFTFRLLPANTEGSYVSYPAGSGRVFVHVEGSYTNNDSQSVALGQLFAPEAVQEGQKLGRGFVLVDREDNRFFGNSNDIVCVPGATCHYHALIPCPAEITQSTTQLHVTMGLPDGNTYRYDLR